MWVKTQLDLNWMKLTDVEKQILVKISQQDQPVSRNDLKESLSLSSTDIINGLQSLTRRFLLTKLESDEKLFYLSPILREYCKYSIME
jgi:predicted HTH transcriptional regulator